MDTSIYIYLVKYLHGPVDCCDSLLLDGGTFPLRNVYLAFNSSCMELPKFGGASSYSIFDNITRFTDAVTCEFIDEFVGPLYADVFVVIDKESWIAELMDESQTTETGILLFGPIQLAANIYLIINNIEPSV